MKKVNLFATLAAAVVLTLGATSCSNDNDDVTNNGKGEKAVLNITLDSPNLSRAAGTAPSTDRTITEFTALVIDNGGNVAWETHVTGTSLSNFTVTTAATEIYVIANGGDQTGKYATKTALLAGKEDLGAMYSKRAATGSSSITWGSGTTASETVTMYFIAARITVKVDNKMTGYDGVSPNTVIINDIAVLNARGQSKFFGTSLVPTYDANKTYMMGMANTTPPLASYPGAGTFTVDATNLNDAYTLATSPATSDYYYYVYETDAITASNPATIVTLIGTDVDGNATYWPVHLTTSEDWKDGTMPVNKIERGKSYDIKITLTGDATNGNGGGTTDPFEPVVNGTLNATLSIENWTFVPLEKEF